MPYRKRTLRKMEPVEREVAKVIDELEMATRRLKRLLLPKIAEFERAAAFMKKHSCRETVAKFAARGGGHGENTPLE